MIPARNAVILCDENLQRVVVVPADGASSYQNNHLKTSGGAAYPEWHESSPQELYFRLMQVFVCTVRDHNIPAGIVHEAFLAMPEYVASLPPGVVESDQIDLDTEPEKVEGFQNFYPM